MDKPRGLSGTSYVFFTKPREEEHILYLTHHMYPDRVFLPNGETQVPNQITTTTTTT